MSLYYHTAYLEMLQSRCTAETCAVTSAALLIEDGAKPEPAMISGLHAQRRQGLNLLLLEEFEARREEMTRWDYKIMWILTSPPPAPFTASIPLPVVDSVSLGLTHFIGPNRELIDKDDVTAHYCINSVHQPKNRIPVDRTVRLVCFQISLSSTFFRRLDNSCLPIVKDPIG
jgi:hypothetical protein